MRKEIHYFKKFSEITGTLTTSLRENNVIHVIEDTECIADLTAELIKERLECGVVAYTHPEKFLNFARIQKTDIFIIDIMMPKIDGVELTKKLINDYGIDPVRIVITSGILEIYHEEFEQIGVEWFFPKPISYRKLVDVIKTIQLV